MISYRTAIIIDHYLKLHHYCLANVGGVVFDQVRLDIHRTVNNNMMFDILLLGYTRPLLIHNIL